MAWAAALRKIFQVGLTLNGGPLWSVECHVCELVEGISSELAGVGVIASSRLPLRPCHVSGDVIFSDVLSAVGYCLSDSVTGLYLLVPHKGGLRRDCVIHGKLMYLYLSRVDV